MTIGIFLMLMLITIMIIVVGIIVIHISDHTERIERRIKELDQVTEEIKQYLINEGIKKAKEK